MEIMNRGNIINRLREINIKSKNDLDILLKAQNDECLKKIILVNTNFVETFDYIFAIIDSMKNEFNEYLNAPIQSAEIESSKENLLAENINLKKILELQKEENDNLKKILKSEKEDADKLAKILDDMEDVVNCSIEDVKSCDSSDFADGMIFILKMIKRQFKY